MYGAVRNPCPFLRGPEIDAKWCPFRQQMQSAYKTNHLMEWCLLHIDRKTATVLCVFFVHVPKIVKGAPWNTYQLVSTEWLFIFLFSGVLTHFSDLCSLLLLCARSTVTRLPELVHCHWADKYKFSKNSQIISVELIFGKHKVRNPWEHQFW